MRAAVAFALALAVVGCGEPRRAVDPAELVRVPPRAVTAGDALLAMAPAGAEVVVEVDVARVRDNPVVGPVVARIASMSVAGLDLGLLAAGQADALLFCAYGVGTDHAAVLTLIRGPRAAELGVRLDERTGALGPPALIERARAVRAGREPALATDRELLAARAVAMPARAEAASVRGAARLGFDARVALASQLDLDQVPAVLWLWGDVVDDLAVVVGVRGADAGEGAALARALERWRDVLAAQPWVRERLLHFTLRTVQISRDGADARAILVIAPVRLRRMTERLLRSLPEATP